MFPCASLGPANAPTPSPATHQACQLRQVHQRRINACFRHVCLLAAPDAQVLQPRQSRQAVRHLLLLYVQARQAAGQARQLRHAGGREATFIKVQLRQLRQLSHLQTSGSSSSTSEVGAGQRAAAARGIPASAGAAAHRFARAPPRLGGWCNMALWCKQEQAGASMGSLCLAAGAYLLGHLVALIHREAQLRDGGRQLHIRVQPDPAAL